LYHDRQGRTMHSFHDARVTLDVMRSEGKAFDPQTYKRQSKTAFSVSWTKFIDKYNDRPGSRGKLKSIKNHLDYFNEYQMRDIKAYHVDEWWQGLKAKGLSGHYSNDILQWLTRFFSEAEKLDIIEKPIKRWPDPAPVPEPEVDAWLSETQQLAILEYLPKHDRPIFDFMFLTGVRVNEATGLQRRDTDWDKHITIIRHTIKRDGSLGPTKNKKKRIIPHVAEIVGCLKGGLSGLHQYAFTNKWGRRYSDDYLRDTFRAACEAAEVKPLKLKNATRHSFGMGMLRKGFDIWQVSKTMGHSDINMTENYAKMLTEEMESAYGRYDKSTTTPRRLGKEGGVST